MEGGEQRWDSSKYGQGYVTIGNTTQNIGCAAVAEDCRSDGSAAAGSADMSPCIPGLGNGPAQGPRLRPVTGWGLMPAAAAAAMRETGSPVSAA